MVVSRKSSELASKQHDSTHTCLRVEGHGMAKQARWALSRTQIGPRGPNEGPRFVTAPYPGEQDDPVADRIECHGVCPPLGWPGWCSRVNPVYSVVGPHS